MGRLVAQKRHKNRRRERKAARGKRISKKGPLFDEGGEKLSTTTTGTTDDWYGMTVVQFVRGYNSRANE
jgi:hypothetical protein